MIVMGMGNKNAVDTTERLCEHLLTEIGSGIDEQSCLFCLNKNGAAQTFVLWMSTLTHITLASHYWHAT